MAPTLCTRSNCIKFLVKNLALVRNVGFMNFPPAKSSVSENRSLGFAILYGSIACLRHIRLHSATREERGAAAKSCTVDESRVVDFPGETVTLTCDMKFMSESAMRAPCYRVLDDSGQPITGSFEQLISTEVAVKMYSDMVTLQTMDTFFYEAQRQGRISFYMASTGEEAIGIASAAALTNEDVIFPQYREAGALLWRGYTLQEFANQLFGTGADSGKGRQMPVHYGSNRLNYFTTSSPIATQLPQAVGAAYSLKMEDNKSCSVAYFGEGASSEGDFHAALNFAAVLEVPIIFICRNNGWAISTPSTEQFRGDGIVVRGPAYGIRSIRVDGNDALAIYNAVKTAREMSTHENRPILIEAPTYRVGHHSTSDDSTRYRPADEIEHWRTNRDPVTRFRKWIESNGWWSDTAEAELRGVVRKQLLDAIQVAEKAKKPPLTHLFTDVYDELPWNLREQEKHLRETTRKNLEEYPSHIPI